MGVEIRDVTINSVATGSAKSVIVKSSAEDRFFDRIEDDGTVAVIQSANITQEGGEGHLGEWVVAALLVIGRAAGRRVLWWKVLHGVQPAIRDVPASTRWGSCSYGGTRSFYAV